MFNRSAVRIWSSLFLVYLVSTRVVPIPSCPLYSSFIALQPPRFTRCSLFLFSTAVLSIVFNSVMFFHSTFQPLKVLCFTHWSKKQLSFTSPLPLSFLSGAILDLGTRSLVSGGVLWCPETDASDAFHVFRYRRMYLFVFCIASCHHAIMSLIFASQRI